MTLVPPLPSPWCTQYRGRVFFRWTDSSACESGFSVSRDGKGFTQLYDYTGREACGEVHSPQSLYDDLSLQASGSCENECVRDGGLCRSQAVVNCFWKST